MQNINSFSSYDLTDEEYKQGSIYTTTQEQVLCNMRANYAEQVLTLEFDTNNVLEFAQTDASLKSKIEFITELLGISDYQKTQHNNPEL